MSRVSPPGFPLRIALTVLLALPIVPVRAAEAQAATQDTAKKILSVDDYPRWRTINDASMSGDGHWVAYVLRHTNVLPADAKPVLHIVNLETNQDVTIADATNATFSPDSRWIAYQVDSTPPPRGGRGGRGGGGGGGGAPSDTSNVSPPAPQAPAPGAGRGGGPTVHHRMELRELASGRTQSWHDMQSAMFSPNSAYLVLRTRPASPSGGRSGRGGGGGGGNAGGGNESTRPRGSDVVLHELSTGRSQFLGSVGEIAFNRDGHFVAYTVDATTRDANGLFVIDLERGRTYTLDNDARTYGRLAWNDDGSGLAVLKGRAATRKRELDNALVAFPALAQALDNPELEPATLDTSAVGFPGGFVISDRAPLQWSEDGRRVFFGMIPQSAAVDTGRSKSTDSLPDVDVWRTDDERIQSVQMVRANADRNFTFREAFDVTAGRFVRLADSTMRDLEIAPDGIWAVGRDARAYVSDYAPAKADFYRVNTSTGERTPLLKGQLTGQHVFGISPDGHWFLFWKNDHVQAIDLATVRARALGHGSRISFVDAEFDHPGPKPSYGVAGYSSDGKGVVVQHRFDLWYFPYDTTASARNLTNGVGTREEIRFRYVRTSPIDSAAPRRTRTGDEIDLSQPVTLSAYGEYTKKSGFYELADGRLRPVVFDDALFSTPQRAEQADRYLFTRQTFVEFPDLRVSGPDFSQSKRISDANPQQAEYRWGRRILFDFRNKDGRRLQGILALPDDYKPGQKLPMLVNFYEKNSQNLHRYPTPSYLTGMGSSPIEAVSRGYITMLPDVWFHTGSSHSDMLECVEAAVRKVIAMGYVDPKHIGINGHSYGGEGAAFIGTRSRLFAAIGMGAGVTDLYTDFNQSWGWTYQVTGGSGANGDQYYLYGQGRWGFSPWDNPDRYHFESALTHVREVTAPFLIMHGTADPTVSFTEGMNFYNALRYNGKEAILLAYPGEGHGLRGLANRRDLTVRFFQFFDHYLKGAPAPGWMTKGVPFLSKDRTKKPG